MALICEQAPRASALLTCPATRRGIISWNTAASRGSLGVRVRFADESWSALLPYVQWSETERVSLGGHDECAQFEIDLLLASTPFTAIELHFTGKIAEVMLATPAEQESGGAKLAPIELDVPKLSQYVGDPGRGWCSPASLAMLLLARGVEVDVPGTAREIYDQAYHGTGNWAFNVAFASRFGLRAFVAYLRGFAHARRFLEAGVPLAISFSWKEGELDGAPLPSSDGHVAVLRGFDANGDPIVNDPAQALIRAVYPRAQLERAWLEHGGIAYVVAPPSVPTIDLANR